MDNKNKKRIAILTGGGDAPGLNAVIYALTKTCIYKYGYDVIGYKFGYRGLLLNDYIPITHETISGIFHKGGSILYNSNKHNLFDFPLKDENGNFVRDENGKIVKRDVSDVAIENLKKEGIDTLVVLGGDGSLTSARDFSKKGINVIGVPKTIDNDLHATDETFGFNTAVATVTEALGKIHTTAESHQRVIIVEVMGRNAGWIALHSGIAGSADVILLPEIPYKLEHIVQKIEERDKRGKPFSIIVVSEGAKEEGGQQTVDRIIEDSPDAVRLGGIAHKLSGQLEKLISDDHEVRPVVLGHIQRGGETSAYDRILSARFGSYAAKMIEEERYGEMVCIKKGELTSMPFDLVVGGQRLIDPDNELIQVARDMGISFGDAPVEERD
ncbi:MAG: ATP-dependent 6-phosphofructokinase [Firmicutes bacterium]|nr:ATP-dependent 6-phosphofructokinase [Bacillota bacterium]